MTRRVGFILLALSASLLSILPGCATPDDTTDQARNPLVDDRAPGDEPCLAVITHATDPATGVCTEFPTPCDVPEGWKPCQPSVPEVPEEYCAAVITYAIDPATSVCTEFATPCDVPEGWEPCRARPCDDGSELVCDVVRPLCGAGQVAAVLDGCWDCVDGVTCEHVICIQVIAHATDPATGVCTEFPTPCDVPAGWERCQPTSR